MAKNINKLFPIILRSRNYSTNHPEKCNNYDLVVIGGGIVGMSSARELKNRHPNLKMAVLEKESKLAAHQTGHNSGVIHAGIYYTPGSLKAKLCVEGMKKLYDYVEEKSIPKKRIGKLIVATDQIEVDRLNVLYERALKNKVDNVELIDEKGIKQIEPHCKGLKAIWSPNTGIIDYSLVTEEYAKDFKTQNGEIYLNFEVNSFSSSDNPDYPVRISSKDNNTVLAKHVLTCGGLHSDRLSELCGCNPNPRIVPFRGEYLLLNKSKTNIVKSNIYPVPDPRFPFLGVHFTPRMNGDVWLGPNAVLAFKREGYSWFDINLKDVWESISHSGFQKLAYKFLSAGLDEMYRSIFIDKQVKMLQKFIPDVTINDVKRGPSGVRAQALDADGNLVDDFFFDMGKGDFGKRILHCRNAPSPGATSSLAIAGMVADKMENQFKL
nr:L-2-hydroxyglutarate dehydrogenase, mitochondrial [Onthophagus taurus]